MLPSLLHAWLGEAGRKPRSMGNLINGWRLLSGALADGCNTHKGSMSVQDLHVKCGQERGYTQKICWESIENAVDLLGPVKK